MEPYHKIATLIVDIIIIVNQYIYIYMYDSSCIYSIKQKYE